MAIGINGLGRIGRLVLKDFFGGLNRKSNNKDIEYIESGDDDLLLHKFVMQTDSKIQYLANEKTLVSSQAPRSIKSFYLQR